MFEKFGNFNSAEEINMSADGLFNEGDMDSLKELAKENGLGDVVDGYIEGMFSPLCDPTTAAIGKLEVEAADMKISELMEDWVEYIKCLCFDDEKIALNVRKADKSLEGCIAELLKWAFAHQNPIDDKIKKAAKLSRSKPFRWKNV